MSLQGFITLAVLVAAVVAQGPPLTVNTPTSVQACLPVQITWSGGTPPYYVTVIPGGQPGGKTIKDFGKQDGTSLTWNVEQNVDPSISIQIRDGTGVLNYSDKVSVQSSTASCGTLASTSNSSTPAPAKAGTTPSTPGSTPSSSTSSPSTNSTTTKPGSTNSSSPSTSTTSPTSGAAPASTTPAATGASTGDASRNFPGFFALGLSAAIAVFA